MYENSCSYQTALDLKRVSPPTLAQVKTEDCITLGQCSPDWTSYRFHQSTFEQLKQSVEKAKAALQDRSTFFGASSAFSDIYSSQRLSDTLDTLPSVQNSNTAANCIGLPVHNSGSASISHSTPSLVLNGNCISTVSAATTGQRYRLDTLQPAGCSPHHPQHGVITSSTTPSSLTTTSLLDTSHVESKARDKSSSVVCSSSSASSSNSHHNNNNNNARVVEMSFRAFIYGISQTLTKSLSLCDNNNNDVDDDDNNNDDVDINHLGDRSKLGEESGN
ncbi:DNA-binding protein D-ETS-3 [Musca vetustissima]|uniref:DNA-binding protein D-ETS-3 n=1 Tax=Musca vetustissima TaxID=27455 RepID=UPI002AB6EBA1|nr:DNA-binding protein D-ETS-3 [Musca vetustissima]